MKKRTTEARIKLAKASHDSREMLARGTAMETEWHRQTEGGADDGQRWHRIQDLCRLLTQYANAAAERRELCEQQRIAMAIADEPQGLAGEAESLLRDHEIRLKEAGQRTTSCNRWLNELCQHLRHFGQPPLASLLLCWREDRPPHEIGEYNWVAMEQELYAIAEHAGRCGRMMDVAARAVPMPIA